MPSVCVYVRPTSTAAAAATPAVLVAAMAAAAMALGRFFSSDSRHCQHKYTVTEIRTQTPNENAATVLRSTRPLPTEVQRKLSALTFAVHQSAQYIHTQPGTNCHSRSVHMAGEPNA